MNQMNQQKRTAYTELHWQVDGFWQEDMPGSEAGLYLTLLDSGAGIGKGKLERLRPILLAWHKGSWYGTEATELTHGDKRMLHLNPVLGLDYLADPPAVGIIKLSWSERLLVLQRIARCVREMLLRGWFVPDSSRWSEARYSWKAAIPSAQEAFEKEWTSALMDASRIGEHSVEKWVGAAVNQFIINEQDVKQAWSQVERAAGSALYQNGIEEEEWLIHIGLQQDTLPFRTALQLIEPVRPADNEPWSPAPAKPWSMEEQMWQARPVIQAREGGVWLPLELSEKGVWRLTHEAHELADLARLEENGASVHSESEEAENSRMGGVPASWLPLIHDKIEKEMLRWVQVLPEFSEKEAVRIRRFLSEDEAWTFLEKGSLQLLEAGCSVLLPSWWEAVRNRRLRLRGKVKSSVGSPEQPMFGLSQIVQFDWKLALGDVELTEEEFMAIAKANKRLFQLGGQWVYLDPKDVQQIKDYMKRIGKKQGLTFRDILEMHLRGDNSFSSELEEAGVASELELNNHLQSWLSQLEHMSELPRAEKPDGFLGDLRPYQLDGLSWMLYLRQFGFGGILADDMGLGKTIQFMAYLVSVKEQRKSMQKQGENLVATPALLICPTSVIGNWLKELERFAPSIQVLLHYGTKRDKGEKLRESFEAADLVITSYAIAHLDAEELEHIQWDVVCLDEAQNIKNVYTKQSAAIRRLPARQRIALTGTPMENRLTELWSIYDFVNPGYLGSLGEFRKAVVSPIEKHRDEKTIAGLKRWVKPFMLRRVKKDPAIMLDLPEKQESKIYVTLSKEQGALYENIVSGLLEKIDKLPPMQRRGLILASLTKLKQVCNHPDLLGAKANAAFKPEGSQKLVRLLEMCEEIAEEQGKCLIFTQFIQMGQQLKRLLEEKLGTEVPYLHGSVPRSERDEMIARFQNNEIPGTAFVLSLKAGGTGLNLTAANHVFHFDRWWNPAIENQATDRAFRIGQTRDVHVHKFITLGTIEEKIDDMIERKQSLSDQVVSQSEQWITELSSNELKELFALRENWLRG